MAYKTVQAIYRFAEHEDEIPPGRVAVVRDEPGVSTVIVRPGHATARFLSSIQEQQRSMLALARWVRLDDTDAAAASHPRRLHTATWRHEPNLPEAVICLPVEGPGWHTWLIRPGEASEALVEQMSETLTAFVRSGIWIQRWDDSDASSEG
jgi:hypothetical protein